MKYIVLLNKLNIYGGYCLKNNYKEFITRMKISAYNRNNKKRATPQRCRPQICRNYILNLAPAAFAAASRRRASAAQFKRGCDLKSEVHKVNLDRLCFFQKIIVHKILETVNIEVLILSPRLVQSHCQRGTASSAFIQEYSYRRNLSAFEIIGNLLGCRLGYFNHGKHPPSSFQTHRLISTD